MNIDSHQHFWKYDPRRHSWIGDDMSVLKRDYLPNGLKVEMAKTGIDGSVAVQADQSIDETDFLLQLASQHDDIKAVVGWVDLLSKSVVEDFDKYSHSDKLSGFRHVVQDEPDEQFVLRSDFQKGISLLNTYGYTYDILAFPNQLPAVVELVKTFPNQPFVLDHMAKPYIKNGEIGQWKKDIERLAVNENVHCKLSGIVTEADWCNWSYDQIVPYLDIILESFGPDRLMFGSDWPVCLLAANYQEVKTIIDCYIQSLSGTEQNNIKGLNAMKFYGIA